jgi:hypothetical protein
LRPIPRSGASEKAKRASQRRWAWPSTLRPTRYRRFSRTWGWDPKLVKIGAKVVHHARSVTFQLAEVAVPRELFAALLARIGRLRAAPSPG